MMSSIPCRSSVPGAIRAIDPSRRGSRRGSSSEGVRVKPRLLAACLSVLSVTQAHLDRASKRVALLDPDLAMSGGACRGERNGEAELCALLKRPCRLRGGAEAAGQPGLAEGREARTDGHTPGCRRDCESDCKIGARFVDPHTPGDVDEDVRRAERDAGVPAEHGDDHREPLGVDAGPDAAGHCEVGRGDERLDLEQDRPGSLERARHGGAHLSLLRLAEERRRIWDADKARAGHFKDAELVGRAEAVLGRAQHTMRVVAVTLELEDAVDQMLEHARTRNGAVLRHVPDEDRRDAVLLRDAQQACGCFADLTDGTWSASELSRVEGLDRVDDTDVRPLALEGRADRFQLGLGQDLDLLGATEPRGAELYLGGRLLARHP